MKLPLYVCLIWHMHQPYYKDPLSNKVTMPWVRLHAAKDYCDMVEILKKYPRIHQNFNLVPSLVDQLEDYVNPEAKIDDVFLNISKKDAAHLSMNEKKFILDNFFMANYVNMIKPYPRYYELLMRRGGQSKEIDDSTLSRYSEQDLRDLQVWFNLAWIDPGYIEQNHALNELVKKGREFSEDDKKAVLDFHFEVIKKIIPTYKRMQDDGQIEVSVTPYYHPILPLVCDTNIAKISMPEVTLPYYRFQHPEDAAGQISSAITHYEKRFGRKPAGMWPSEGSVSEEVIRLLIDNKLNWVATDEEILLKSEQQKRSAELIYKPYKMERENGSINIVFRDRYLSDLIGFTYSQMSPIDAANDLIGHFHRIYQYLKDQEVPVLVTLILDGENAWEYFPQDGRRFLEAFYDMLSLDKNIEPITVSEFLEKHPPQENIKKIFPGSWINANFGIWIGHKEKNLAWDYLYNARKTLDECAKKGGIPKEKLDAAWKEIYIAEGSDWNWWYGDNNTSANDEEFDRIYRSHLANVYELIACPVPEYLNIPIISEISLQQIEPKDIIHPIIDGRDSFYYEWINAGYLDIKKTGGAMHKSASFIQRVYFGYDADFLYFRLDFIDPGLLTKHITINFTFLPQDVSFTFYGPKFKKSTHPLKSKISKRDLQYSYSKIFELAVNSKTLGITQENEQKVLITIKANDIIVEKVPEDKALCIKMPDKNFTAGEWSAL